MIGGGAIGVTEQLRDLPKPKWAFRPPKFRTRNSPDFLKLQSRMKPKSDDKTHVPQANPINKE